MIGGVLLGGVLQSVGLAAAILAMGRDSIANRFLALTLAVLAGMMSVFVLGWTGRVEVSPWLAFLPVNLPLALGPALFAYILGLVRDEALGRWHFAPAVVHFVYLVVLQLLPEAPQVAWKAGVHDAAVKPLVEIATVVSLVAYTVAGLRLLGDYRVWLAQQRSDADRYAARWIGGVMIAFAVTTAALALLRFYTTFVGELDTGPLNLWFAAWSAWLGIEGWRQCDRRYPVMQTAPAPDVAEATGPDWAALGQRWRQEIEAQGWWRQADLSLAEAARRVGTNTTYLSRAINEGLGLNFNELINRMRAEEVARRIEAAEEPNFMQLALEAGFNSKATFNRAFRAVHGISPSDYRLRLKSQKSAGSPGSEAPHVRSPGT
jgi:AraC-like DNA-binding protein